MFEFTKQSEWFGIENVKSLFSPGSMPVVPRRANHLKKGYLKRSSFTAHWWSATTAHQGEREKARRLRQIERG